MLSRQETMARAMNDLIEMIKSGHEERCPEGGPISRDDWSDMWQELAGEIEELVKTEVRRAGYLIQD